MAFVHQVSRFYDRPPPPTTAVLASATPVSPKPKPKPKVVHRVVHRLLTAVVPSHYGNLYLVTMAKCIRSHESGVYTRDSGNGYYGAYQFSAATWAAVTGLAKTANYYAKAVQDYWFMHTWAKLKTTASRLRQWSSYRYCTYIQP